MVNVKKFQTPLSILKKRFVYIVNRKDPDQTVSLEAV